MAGIFGVQDYSGVRDVSRASDILLLAAQQGFNHPAGVRTFAHSAVGFACPPHYSSTNWPLISQDGKSALSVFGEIYLPNGTALRDDNFELEFLQPLLDSPNEFLLRLDGAFCFALMTDRECLIASDPFGTFALHYASTPDTFVFSSQMDSVRRVLQDSGRTVALDETSVLQQLGLGMTLMGRTPFQGISRLPGGSYLRSSANRMELVRYFTPHYAARTRDTKRILQNIGSAIETSVLRRTQSENVVVPLTGGFDSRATWSVILKNQIPITAQTHGIPGCNDLRIATRIARTLKLKHYIQEWDDYFQQSLPDHWAEVVRLTEGAISIAHTPALLMWKDLSQHFSIILDSYGGAFYRRQRMKVAERRIDTNKDLIPQLMRFERSPLLASKLLRADVRREIETISDNALREYYDSISETLLLGDKLDRFHFEQVDAMKDSLGANAQMNFIGLSHPMLSLPAIEAAMQLPIAERRRDAVHKYMIHNSFPALERFALDNVGFIAPYRGFSTLRYGAMVAEQALRQAAKLLPKTFRDVSLRRPTMDAAGILKYGRPFARELLLSSHPVYDSLIDSAAVDSTLQEMESGDYSAAGAIIQLLTFRLFLDIFV